MSGVGGGAGGIELRGAAAFLSFVAACVVIMAVFVTGRLKLCVFVFTSLNTFRYKLTSIFYLAPLYRQLDIAVCSSPH